MYIMFVLIKPETICRTRLPTCLRGERVMVKWRVRGDGKREQSPEKERARKKKNITYSLRDVNKML